jgi:hypothetical protein
LPFPTTFGSIKPLLKDIQVGLTNAIKEVIPQFQHVEIYKIVYIIYARKPCIVPPDPNVGNTRKRVIGFKPNTPTNRLNSDRRGSINAIGPRPRQVRIATNEPPPVRGLSKSDAARRIQRVWRKHVFRKRLMDRPKLISTFHVPVNHSVYAAVHSTALSGAWEIFISDQAQTAFKNLSGSENVMVTVFSKLKALAEGYWTKHLVKKARSSDFLVYIYETKISVSDQSRVSLLPFNYSNVLVDRPMPRFCGKLTLHGLKAQRRFRR